MGVLDYLRNSELQIGDFLIPWGMMIGALGFLTAWVVMLILERTGLTRKVWHIPLFFVALAVLFGCVIGLILAP